MKLLLLKLKIFAENNYGRNCFHLIYPKTNVKKMKEEIKTSSLPRKNFRSENISKGWKVALFYTFFFVQTCEVLTVSPGLVVIRGD